jgi:hypothetical protein
MKTSVPVGKRTVRIVPCIIVILLVTAGVNSFAIPNFTPAEVAGVYYMDSIVVEKRIISKKYKIKLYPNASQQVLFFNASGEEGIVYQLYIFDIEGQIVKRANIRNKQTTVINIIEKGIYLFEVFIEDKRIETGKVTFL